jgi:hypothetical protein
MQSDINYMQAKRMIKLTLFLGASIMLSACGSGNVQNSNEDVALRLAATIDDGASASADTETAVANALIKAGF